MDKIALYCFPKKNLGIVKWHYGEADYTCLDSLTIPFAKEYVKIIVSADDISRSEVNQIRDVAREDHRYHLVSEEDIADWCCQMFEQRADGIRKIADTISVEEYVEYNLFYLQMRGYLVYKIDCSADGSEEKIFCHHKITTL